MLAINESLRPRNIITYPPYTTQTYEEYFYDEYCKHEHNYTDRIYIPIFWTNYYISKNYGHGDLSEIQSLIDGLDKTKKYFTLVQCDENIMNDLEDLDILILSSGGYGKYKEKSYVIPLICDSTYPMYPNSEKDILASFIGIINNRHIIREKLEQSLANKKEYVISESIGYEKFIEIMQRSIFSLCPRGYGLTSFRICEALRVGSIPVYIYDEPLIPFIDKFNFEDIGILIHESQLGEIDNILKGKSIEEIEKYTSKGVEIYNEFFTYKGCYEKIIEVLKKEENI